MDPLFQLNVLPPWLLTVWDDADARLGLWLVAILLLRFWGKATPTWFTLALLAIPFAISVLGFAAVEWMWLSDWTLVALVVLVLIDRFGLTPNPNTLEIQRTLEPRLSIGRPQDITLTVVNHSTVPIRGQIIDDPPEFIWTGKTSPLELLSVTVAPQSKKVLTYSVTPNKRGAAPFGEIRLRYESALGLLRVSKKQQILEPDTPSPQILRVYPDLVRIQQMRLKYSQSLHAGALIQRRMGVEGTQFAGLRAYAQGDDMRKIDWQATARMAEPVVRTYETEVDQPIQVLLDMGRKMQTKIEGLSKLDWALNAGLAFASVALERGDQVGIGAFHQQVVVDTPLDTGLRYTQLLLDSVHDLTAQDVEPDYVRSFLHFSRKLSRRSLIVIFTDLIDPVASKQLIQGVQLFTPPHLPLIVTLADPELDTRARKLPDDSLEASEKGVAQDLLNLRRLTHLQLAQRLGATVVDVPPHQMDEALINAYLSIKQKNAL